MTLEDWLKKYQENIKQKPLTSAIVLIVLLLFLLIVVPYADISLRGINNATVEATLENQSRATLAQILGGVAIAIGLYYTWRRIAIAEKDLKVTEDNLKIAQDNLKVTQDNLKVTQGIAQDNLKVAQEGQITERFTRAVDQLGNPAMEIRLGGIYALERIANESEKDSWPIMEILTAYVRKNSMSEYNQYYKMFDIQGGSDQDPPDEISLDIQAILTVIGRRKNSIDPVYFNIDLRRTNLRKADLRNANLQWVDLKWTNLERAILMDANLEYARFAEASLISAIFLRANLKKANLKKAELTKAYFEETDLKGADLSGAILIGARNLTVDQLSKAKTLYKAELDEGLEAELRAKGFGHLLDDDPKD
jgi:hypothetical protein